MWELKYSLVIEDFITKVKMADKRKAKYYNRSSKIPLKYQDKTKYDFKVFNGKSILIDLKTKEKVIANPKVVGTPRYQLIKGNDFYAGFGNFSERSSVVYKIKQYFKPYFLEANLKFDSVDYPLFIEFKYYDLKAQSQDLDNKRFAYEKCILDLMQDEELKILPDDDVNYVIKLSSEFIPVDEGERKLEINFYVKSKTETSFN